MGKQEDLDTIDELVRKTIINCLENGSTEVLQDLSPAIAYLSKNNVVSDKKKQSSVEEDIAKRLEEAKARRGNN